jgi:hypothetical protein
MRNEDEGISRPRRNPKVGPARVVRQARALSNGMF